MADRFVSLQQVRDLGGIEHARDDSVLDSLILAATGLFQELLTRRLISATYSHSFDGTGTARLQLRAFPVTAVASLSVNGLAIQPRQQPGALGYTFTEHQIRLHGGQVFERGLDNVSVTYTAGLAEAPADIRHACAEVVLARYRARDRHGLQSKTLAGETVTFSQEDLTPFARRVLDQHKSVALP